MMQSQMGTNLGKRTTKDLSKGPQCRNTVKNTTVVNNSSRLTPYSCPFRPQQRGSNNLLHRNPKSLCIERVPWAKR